MHTPVCTHTHTKHSCACTHTHACTHTCIHTHTCTHTHTTTQSHKHMHAHAYIHTHTHMHTMKYLGSLGINSGWSNQGVYWYLSATHKSTHTQQWWPSVKYPLHLEAFAPCNWSANLSPYVCVSWTMKSMLQEGSRIAQVQPVCLWLDFRATETTHGRDRST